MARSNRSRVIGVGVGAAALLLAAATPALAQGSAASAAPVNGLVHFMAPFHGVSGSHPGQGKPGRSGGSSSNQLIYNGGLVQGTTGNTQKVYIIYWGTQWGSGGTITNDPSGEIPLQDSFMSALNSGSGDTWSTTVTQYCDGTTSGVTTCPSSASFIQEPSSSVVAGTWWDNSSSAPKNARQSQIATEAAKAAAHFGNYSANAQYIIDFPHGVSPSGFGKQYCAWHSSTSANGATISYTNFPYITDAGASCGANFNNLGPDAGITIVGGHEYAEALTDPQPSSGWLSGGGSEIGDLCAWSSGTADVTLGGVSYPVQPLWSNASASCVLNY